MKSKIQMSIKIDPKTQKAVNPESIGKDDWKRGVLAIAVIVVLAVVVKYFGN